VGGHEHTWRNSVFKRKTVSVGLLSLWGRTWLLCILRL